MNCIYKIYSEDEMIHKSYIGYAKSLYNRVACHKFRCFNNTKTNLNYNNDLYIYIRKYGWDKFNVEIIESLPTYDRDKLKQLERHYYNLLKPELNKNVPLRGIKEYCEDTKLKYINKRLSNREKHNEYCKKRNASPEFKEIVRKRANKYYHENIEKITKNNNIVVGCMCGAQIKHSNFKNHIKSKNHSIQLDLVLNSSIDLFL